MDTTYKTADGIFNYRVGAIIPNGTKVLMTHDKKHDQYYTIGGRAHFGETSGQAMLREIFEEIGIKAELDRLAFINENFFAVDGTPVHELAFYWLVKPFDLDSIDYSAIKCDETDAEICWIDFEDKAWCRDKLIYPLWLEERILNIPETVSHIVTVEDGFYDIKENSQ